MPGPACPRFVAGGFAREDHCFKALALGAPFTRLVCLGRAPMIPAFVGSNIEGALRPERGSAVFGHWDDLPASVSAVGDRPEEIFAAWEAVVARVGADERQHIPYGAVAMDGYATGSPAASSSSWPACASRGSSSSRATTSWPRTAGRRGRAASHRALTDAADARAMAILEA